jgi:hypothetical protein
MLEARRPIQTADGKTVTADVKSLLKHEEYTETRASVILVISPRSKTSLATVPPLLQQ